MQPQMQPAAPVPAPAPVARDAFGALDEDLFSEDPTPALAEWERRSCSAARRRRRGWRHAAGFAAGPPRSFPRSAAAAPPLYQTPAMLAMPAMPTMPAAPETRARVHRGGVRSAVPRARGGRWRGGRPRAAAADAGRRIGSSGAGRLSQAKATSASLTQRLRDLVMFSAGAGQHGEAALSRAARRRKSGASRRGDGDGVDEQAGGADAPPPCREPARRRRSWARLREIETADLRRDRGVPERRFRRSCWRARACGRRADVRGDAELGGLGRVQDDGIDVVNISGGLGGWHATGAASSLTAAGTGHIAGSLKNDHNQTVAIRFFIRREQFPQGDLPLKYP